MTSLAKIEANHKNSQRSTGPKTMRGKAASRMNATSHGLRSLSPVLPGERPKDWNDHRAGIISALAPVGHLEAELVERVALLMWRLRRVIAYETSVCAAEIEEDIGRLRGEDEENNPLESILALRGDSPPTYATVRKELEAAQENAKGSADISDKVRKLADLPPNQELEAGEAFLLLSSVSGYVPDGDGETIDIEDHEFLAEVGVPEEWRDDPDWWNGWTAETVRAGLKIIAEDAGMSSLELIEKVVREATQKVEKETRKIKQLEQQLAYYANQLADKERFARGRALLPPSDLADKVVRYESHLNKQLMQTLHQLERMQAIRGGSPPEPPPALDVTFETGGFSPELRQLDC